MMRRVRAACSPNPWSTSRASGSCSSPCTRRWAPRRGEPLAVDARAGAARPGPSWPAASAATPTPVEVAATLRVELDEERLYREALALGLDRDDPIVRRRLIQKLRFVHEDLGEPGEPDDAPCSPSATPRPPATPPPPATP
jgi:hypothetical protein